MDGIMYSLIILMFVSGFGFVTFALNSAKTPPESLMAMTIAAIFIAIPFLFMRSASKLSAMREIVNEIKEQHKREASKRMERLMNLVSREEIEAEERLRNITESVSRDTASINSTQRKRRMLKVEK
jgi:hypothetical protein